MKFHDFAEKAKNLAEKAKILLADASEKVAAQKRTRLELTISCVSLILSLGILATTMTTAWIRRKWSSEIREDAIKIETNGSLAFIINPYEEDAGNMATNTISILQQLKINDFTLKPVSNLTGQTDSFFLLNKDTVGGEYYEHILTPNSASKITELAKEKGYLEFKFTLLGESVYQEGQEVGGATATPNYEKYVYFDAASSYIAAFDDGISEEDDPSQAIRISITVDNNTTYVFRNPIHDAQPGQEYMHTALCDDKSPLNEWYIDSFLYYEQETGLVATVFPDGHTLAGQSIHETVQAHAFSEFDGAITSVTEGDTTVRYIDTLKCLTHFSPNSSKSITVRVWLEGTDPVCEDAIAGMKIKLRLVFEAANVTDIDGDTRIGKILESGGAVASPSSTD